MTFAKTYTLLILPFLSFCQKPETSFEIKASIFKCMKPKGCDDTFHCAPNEPDFAKWRSKCEQEDDQAVIERCEKKISLTLKIQDKGVTICQPQFIVVDHVYDAITDQKQRLLHPYVLKMTQKPVYQVYDLIYENVVNGGPTEKVLSKNDKKYSGCSTDPVKPTCGIVQYGNTEVPYSTGFCCSCDSSKTTVDEIFDFVTTRTADESMTYNLDLPNLHGPPIKGDVGLTPEIPYLPEDNKNDYGNDEQGGKIKGPSPRIRRQYITAKPKHIHRRGGQDCNDFYVPVDADPNTYHDSTHCLEFSDSWYSLYQITHPTIDHLVYIQIFEKIGTKGCAYFWRDVTSKGHIMVGTTKERFSNNKAYYSINGKVTDYGLNAKIHKLLIPEMKDGQPDGGAEEYLVIKENDIDLSGKTCNKAGVGYEAFATQPNRCQSDRNSCLKNQPSLMWQHDKELEAKGKQGCYFLKNYGLLPGDAVREKPCNSTRKNSNKLLYMYYLSCLTSNVDISFAADENSVLRPDFLAMINEVYTETLNPKKTTIIAKIFNSGLTTSVFHIALGTCPVDLPASFGSITSQSVLIAPQHQHIFTLEVYLELNLKHFYCNLEVFNSKQQLLAVRRIRFVRDDRCICVWYCQCACFRSDGQLKCEPMEIDEYHAAGFQEGMPIATQVVQYSDFDDTMSIILHIILFFCLTLWWMGIFKAFLGCCIISIGLWGLDKVLDLPKKINRYFEPELQEQTVIYNDEGWPIHPQKFTRVHDIPPTTMFAVNLAFFFIFPFSLIWNTLKRALGSKYSPDSMFSDLDICDCKASQMSLLKNYSLQNKKPGSSVHKNTEDANKTPFSNTKHNNKRCTFFRKKGL